MIILIEACIFIAIIMLSIYLFKKFSINYKTFFLHSVLGYIGCMGIVGLILFLNPNIRDMQLPILLQVSLALSCYIIGFLIPKEIISFTFLFLGLGLGWSILANQQFFRKLAETTNIPLLGNMLAIAPLAFLITIGTLILWMVLYKKYKVKK